MKRVIKLVAFPILVLVFMYCITGLVGVGVFVGFVAFALGMWAAWLFFDEVLK